MPGEKHRQRQTDNELRDNRAKRKQHSMHNRLAKNRILENTDIVAQANKRGVAAHFSLQIITLKAHTEAVIERIAKKEQQVEDSRNQKGKANQALAIQHGPGMLRGWLL